MKLLAIVLGATIFTVILGIAAVVIKAAMDDETNDWDDDADASP